MRSTSHLPGVWSMISFGYEKYPGPGIAPLSTYQTKSYKRASSRSIPRTSHRWWPFNGFGDGLNVNVDSFLSLFTLFAVPVLRPATISTTNSPCSKTQQLLCLHRLAKCCYGTSLSHWAPYSCHPSESTLWLSCPKTCAFISNSRRPSAGWFPLPNAVQSSLAATNLPLFSAVDIP